jgi:hypothetical protein
MLLSLSELPESLRHYTDKPVPKWMRRLAPEAAGSLLRIEAETGGLVYTDLWRSAEVSLAARADKHGVQPPAYSAHNFGYAIDVALEETMRRRDWSYVQLVGVLEGYGWHCHRRDISPEKPESWHFNHLGPGYKAYLETVSARKPTTWHLAAEARIQKVYGDALQLDTPGVQYNLQKLKMYVGEIDGVAGPITRQGVLAFQRAWGLPATGQADEKTQRTLAFIAADVSLVPPVL